MDEGEPGIVTWLAACTLGPANDGRDESGALVTDREPPGGTMTKLRAAMGFLLAAAASSFRALRRTIKRLAGPGTGPFLSGV